MLVTRDCCVGLTCVPCLRKQIICCDLLNAFVCGYTNLLCLPNYCVEQGVVVIRCFAGNDRYQIHPSFLTSLTYVIKYVNLVGALTYWVVDGWIFNEEVCSHCRHTSSYL